MNRKEFAKYQSKDIWYSRKYLTEESQRAAAKAAGITWEEAKEWESYWNGVLYASAPTVTVFDFNPTRAELDELFIDDKETYMNFLSKEICGLPATPWRTAMGHVVRLFSMRGDKENEAKYDAMIPSDLDKVTSSWSDLS